jgi:hypothetical protein
VPKIEMLEVRSPSWSILNSLGGVAPGIISDTLEQERRASNGFRSQRTLG